MPAQTPNVYTFPRTEPGTRGHLDLVEPLRSVPHMVAEELKGAREADLSYRPSADAWPIRLIVGHLRDAAEIYHKRLYMMSTQADPVLEPYDEQERVAAGDYMNADVDQVMREMREFRARTTALLTSLVNWNWARTGVHLENGRMSIRQLVEHMIEHEHGHVAHIRALRIAAEEARA
ncbi:MAG: DinB family protein [Chloroflexi bacterium]|nr:DinB family protein [Chloroflexota bacterium]